MGLFSFGNKNKQDTARDSGHFVKDDDAAYTERARSKRASAADGARRTSRGDPILPEKKRARRRLVGAIALVLAAVVALPMLLDSEPKPLATDIAVHIPDKERAAPLPVPSEQVPASASVDSDEEIVEPVPAPPAATSREPASTAAAPATPAASAPPPMRMLEPAKPVETPKPAAKPAPAKTEPASDAKPEPKPERKSDPVKKPEPLKKPAAETHPKAEQVAKPAPKADDAARAIAILEGKPAAAAEPQKPQGPAPKFVVQVAALASQEKVAELQDRLRGAGIASFTQKSGELIRVRIGPMNKDEADKVRAKLGGIGLSGSMVPL